MKVQLSAKVLGSMREGEGKLGGRTKGWNENRQRIGFSLARKGKHQNKQQSKATYTTRQ